jgi:hypothetical protein
MLIAIPRNPHSVEIRRLIRRMAAENPTWGEERIADELLLKLHVRLSPRTVGKYIQQQPCPRGSRDQRWSTFLRNHAHGVVACDFFVSVTASFRILYVFVVLEIGSRRLVHFNVTEHPTAEWTLQQLREALPGDSDCKFLLHDRHNSRARILHSACCLNLLVAPGAASPSQWQYPSYYTRDPIRMVS